MQSTNSLLSLADPLLLVVVASYRALSMGPKNETVYLCETKLFEKELFRHLTACKQKDCTDTRLNSLEWNCLYK